MWLYILIARDISVVVRKSVVLSDRRLIIVPHFSKKI